MLSSTTEVHTHEVAADPLKLTRPQTPVTDGGFAQREGDHSRHVPDTGGHAEPPHDSAAGPGTQAASDPHGQSNAASGKSCGTAPDAGRTGEAETEAQRPERDREAFTRLVQRANQGDQAALQELRAVLDRCPEIWRKIGDLATHAELATLRLVGGNDKLLMEAMQRKVDELKAGLSRPGASMLEQLVVLRVVVTWLQVQHADTASASPDHSLQQGRFWGQRQDQAHRRHLTAIKDLAKLQQMLPVGDQNVPNSAQEAEGTGTPAGSARSSSAYDGGRPAAPSNGQEDGAMRERVLPIVAAGGSVRGREAASG